MAFSFVTFLRATIVACLSFVCYQQDIDFAQQNVQGELAQLYPSQNNTNSEPTYSIQADQTEVFEPVPDQPTYQQEHGTSSSSESSTSISRCDPAHNQGCDHFFKDPIPSPLSVNHTCVDYVRQKRGDESHVWQLIEKGRQGEQDVIGWWYSDRYRSFQYINGPNPGQEFGLCIIPKNGVTRIKILIMRILGLRGDVHGGLGYKIMFQLPVQKRMELLRSLDFVRVKLVRNPYIRAISMYKDKIIPIKPNRQGIYYGRGLYFKSKPTFEDFIIQLYHSYRLHHSINGHFAPQYERCWEHVGLKPDYVLKIERMNYWYPCLIENFNLWQYVMKGWNDEDHCYFSTKEVPCNGPTQDENGKLIYEKEEGRFGDGISSSHNHDSFKQIKEFYQNHTIAAMVTEMYLNDIVQYGYPFWNEMVGEK